MRNASLLGVALLALSMPLCAGAQQQQQQPPPPPPPKQTVADAARKARAAKKNEPKPAKVYTNDNLPTSGFVNVVGTESAPVPAAKPGPEAAKPAAGEQAAPQKEEKGEAYWRKRFAEARQKLQMAQQELDIMQRELNLLSVQFYSDPSKAMNEQLSRKELNDKQQAIDAKKKEVDQLKQALADLEVELRRSGGDPGWAR